MFVLPLVQTRTLPLVVQITRTHCAPSRTLNPLLDAKLLSSLICTVVLEELRLPTLNNKIDELALAQAW